jgi:hypothetical protein
VEIRAKRVAVALLVPLPPEPIMNIPPQQPVTAVPIVQVPVAPVVHIPAPIFARSPGKYIDPVDPVFINWTSVRESKGIEGRNHCLI